MNMWIELNEDDLMFDEPKYMDFICFQRRMRQQMFILFLFW